MDPRRLSIFFDQWRGWADLAARAVHHRGQLFTAETQLAGQQLFLMAALAGGIAACALALLAALTLLVLFVLWDHPHRLMILTVGSALLSLLLLFLLLFIRHLWRNGNWFSHSRQQWAEDLTCLRTVIDHE